MLGNGTACREAQGLLSEAISRGLMEVSYCIVDERGASIYSCSPLAAQEFPSLGTPVPVSMPFPSIVLDPVRNWF